MKVFSKSNQFFYSPVKCWPTVRSRTCDRRRPMHFERNVDGATEVESRIGHDKVQTLVTIVFRSDPRCRVTGH